MVFPSSDHISVSLIAICCCSIGPSASFFASADCYVMALEELFGDPFQFTLMAEERTSEGGDLGQRSAADGVDTIVEPKHVRHAF